jgi:hypothetical protein
VASYALNNFRAPEQYLPVGATATDSAGQTCGPATLGPLPLLSHINLNVNNASVYFSLMLTNDLSVVGFGAWQPETFLTPGYMVIQRFGVVGIRVRAAVKATNLPAGGTQAQVTVECVDLE